MKPKKEHRNLQTSLGLTVEELYSDIMTQITMGDRNTLVDVIIELADDEFEDKESLIELAKYSLAELKQTLWDIYGFYLEDAIETEIQTKLN